MSTVYRKVYYLILLGFIIIWLRTFYLSIISHRSFSEKANSQYQAENILYAKRGQIITSDGFVLAKSVATNSAQKFTRIYPDASQSGYLTGFVGKNEAGSDTGYFGLEGYFDRQLAGKPGKVSLETDVYNKPILIGSMSEYLPIDGSDLITTIDSTIQYFANRALSNSVLKYQAEGGSIVVMESRSGKVVGMVNYPSYNPNKYWDYSTSDFKNPIVSSGYEPGSTFKPLVMAAALNEGVINLSTICQICNRPMEIGDWTIRSYNDKYYPNSSLYDIILHSDNVGMAFISQKLGKKPLIKYLKMLNFGVKTGIELQEESSPPLKKESEWYDIDLATASFGQGIAVTRLQMVSAINTLANDGLYISPTVNNYLRNGDKIIKNEPQKPHRVYSKSTSQTVVDMMINGVEKGEVRYYKPKGYLIAGKTGTAQVPLSGHYDESRVISSFIGFAPALNPKFTMLVTLDNPKTSPWGSTTAAPTWFDMARELFRYYKIPPTN